MSLNSNSVIYSKSIFCDVERQLTTRPSNWYSTSVIEDKQLMKFSWISPSDIAFEVSYTSVHSPLNCDWADPKSQLILCHNRNVLPFGVMSFKGENRLFWRNCSINYLIEYNIHYRQKKAFQLLINNLSKFEAIPAHWAESLLTSQAKMEVAKSKFKQCRKYEKTLFGYIEHRTLPHQIKKELVAYSRLINYYKYIPHNKLIAANCIESFFLLGFANMARSYEFDDGELVEFGKLSFGEQVRVLQAYLKERITVARRVTCDLVGSLSIELVVCHDKSMVYFLSFSNPDGGSIHHLSGFSALSLKYKDIFDVAGWFVQDHLAA